MGEQHKTKNTINRVIAEILNLGFFPSIIKKTIIAKRKIMGCTLNINAIPKIEAEKIMSVNFMSFFVIKYKEKIDIKIGKRSFNGEVERIPSQGLNAINSCPTNAIFVLKMFLKTI